MKNTQNSRYQGILNKIASKRNVPSQMEMKRFLAKAKKLLHENTSFMLEKVQNTAVKISAPLIVQANAMIPSVSDVKSEPNKIASCPDQSYQYSVSNWSYFKVS